MTTLTLHLATEADTTCLAAVIAPLSRAGDTLLLDGAIGAGKTHFCRAFIQARMGRAEDVPSPTFTLVQTYEADVEIWHADLYRLGHPDEVLELGLDDAFATAICLIEWSDRLGSHLPQGALRIRLSDDGNGRRAEIDFGARPELAAMVRAGMSRVRNVDDFLQSSGWGDARRTPLAGDASARRYERLALGDKTAILMDAPPGQADDIADFVRIDRHLLSIGLSAPKLLADDMAQGLLLLEDFGDGVFARLAEAEPPPREPQLYEAATDVLLHLQSKPPAPSLPNLTALEWARAADLVVEWYRFAITGDRSGGAEFVDALHEALAKWADGPRVMVLRDYHAENLMFLADRMGVKSVGLLDFQLAQLGQPGYDLVSLLQDARRDVTPEIEHQMINRFLAGSGMDEAAFRPAYAALGAQRALRILGIFARLCLRDSKAGYVALLPRVWSQLQRNLAHPALTQLAKVCGNLIPEPTPHLKWIEGQCGNFH